MRADFLRKIGKIIRRKSVGGGEDAVVAEFFEEVERYKQPLTQSYAKILGKERAERVVKLDKGLLSPDSYLFKSAQLEEFILGGFSEEKNLLFYVGIDLGKNDEFEIGSTGRIEGHSRVLKTFPLFFLSPEMIKEHARELKNTSMPVYFTTWLHEYCHFIGYGLQKRPLGAAYAILYAELLRDSHEGLSFRDIVRIMDAEKDEMSAKVAGTIFFLHRLDEGMANFLQELLLEELGFNPGNYFVELMQENPFYPYFKKWGRERYVEYLVDWNNAKLRAPQFMKNFLKSLNGIEVERYPIGNFQKSEDRDQKSEDTPVK
jgi:hypothetical protein